MITEYRKIINSLDNAPNQATKFWTKNRVEKNDEECGTYNTNNQIIFKTSMLRSSLCNYSDAYILVSGTITVTVLEADRRNDDIQVVFKSCGPFTNCISQINNTQIVNAKYVDVLMSMYNLIEYTNNHSKASWSLRHYYTDEPALNDTGTPVNFPGNSASFKFKQKITGSTGDDRTKNFEIIVPLKYLSTFWRTTAMPLMVKLISF